MKTKLLYIICIVCVLLIVSGCSKKEDNSNNIENYETCAKNLLLTLDYSNLTGDLHCNIEEDEETSALLVCNNAFHNAKITYTLEYKTGFISIYEIDQNGEKTMFGNIKQPCEALNNK